jgi:hypothetical protein
LGKVLVTLDNGFGEEERKLYTNVDTIAPFGSSFVAITSGDKTLCINIERITEFYIDSDDSGFAEGEGKEIILPGEGGAEAEGAGEEGS